MKKHRCILTLIGCTIVALFSLTQIISSDNLPEVSISISVERIHYSINESINVTVNITNHGSRAIGRDGYCFIFSLEIGDATRLLFCPYNASMGVIPPGNSYEQTLNLLEYSADTVSWEGLRTLTNGTYKLTAVYGDHSNPWFNATAIPYNATISNSLTFSVGSTMNDGNINDDTIYLYEEITVVIIAIISVSGLVYWLKRKR